MIMNGKTFAHSSFQIDTRPLYINFAYDIDAGKWAPDVDYTAKQIIEISKTRQVIAKIKASAYYSYFVPLVCAYDNGENSTVEFAFFKPYDPNDLTSYEYARAYRDKNGWVAEWNDA